MLAQNGALKTASFDSANLFSTTVLDNVSWKEKNLLLFGLPCIIVLVAARARHVWPDYLNIKIQLASYHRLIFLYLCIAISNRKKY